MFESLFNKCPHEYKQVGYIPAVVEGEEGPCDVPCYFLECKHCGKRRVLREANYAYSDSFLDMLDLWVKGQFKINFKDYQEKSKGEPHNGCSCNSKYEKILEQILSEINRLELPSYDSNGKLVVNNIKGIIKDALSEEGSNEET